MCEGPALTSLPNPVSSSMICFSVCFRLWRCVCNFHSKVLRGLQADAEYFSKSKEAPAEMKARQVLSEKTYISGIDEVVNDWKIEIRPVELFPARKRMISSKEPVVLCSVTLFLIQSLSFFRKSSWICLCSRKCVRIFWRSDRQRGGLGFIS